MGQRPMPWKRNEQNGTALEERAAELLRATGEPPLLSEEAVTRLRWRMSTAAKKVRSRRPSHGRALLVAALVGGSLAAAAIGQSPLPERVRTWVTAGLFRPQPSKLAARPQRQEVLRAPEREAVETEKPRETRFEEHAEAPQKLVPGAEPLTRRERTRRRFSGADRIRSVEAHAPVAARDPLERKGRSAESDIEAPPERAPTTSQSLPIPTPAPAPPVTGVRVIPEHPLATESKLLARALTQLRRENNPGSALESLDEYEQQFPNGALLTEALLARVEALRQLKRTRGALAALERLLNSSEGSGLRNTELELLHAELLAERSSCEKALPLFQQVLQRSEAKVDLSERARYGLAACLITTGETELGRRELSTYLSKYPNGRFAEKARSALERVRKLTSASQ